MQWAWLTLNIALILSTTILLMITIWRARRAVNLGTNSDGQGSWQSSSLPLLWCGLEDSSRENNGLLDEVDQMEDWNDLLEVRLVKLPKRVTVESEVPPGKLEQSQVVSGMTGRWVLQEQRQFTTPGSQFRLRRWGTKWGQNVPI